MKLVLIVFIMIVQFTITFVNDDVIKIFFII